MRRIKLYPPDERRWNVPNNLQCAWCGNTEAFYVDLKLPYLVTRGPWGSYILDINSATTKKVMASIAQNVARMVDKALMEGREIIGCANCQDGDSVDLQERLLDWCWMRGCPGCDICGEYIDEDVAVDLCCDCLTSNEGSLAEEDCRCCCPHYEDSLLDVLSHYGLTLDDVKKMAGF